MPIIRSDSHIGHSRFNILSSSRDGGYKTDLTTEFSLKFKIRIIPFWKRNILRAHGSPLKVEPLYIIGNCSIYKKGIVHFYMRKLLYSHAKFIFGVGKVSPDVFLIVEIGKWSTVPLYTIKKFIKL